jgi:hypothetical protein
MKSKSLEAFLARESGQFPDMVTRFQKLRDFNLLSKARGRNAEYLSPEEIAAGICGVVSERPGFAPVTAIGLLNMRAIGIPEDAFGGASTLRSAIVKALTDEAVRETLIEIRLGDSDPRAHNSTTAAIVYRSGDEVLTSFYIGDTAVSQFVKGKEKTFNRGDMGDFSITRETVISYRLIDRLARSMEEADRYRKLEAQMEQHLDRLQG